jgi:hypothetical protein
VLVSIRHIADCPSLEMAHALLREALIVTGHADAVIWHELIATEEQAVAVSFRGSPTFLLDGHDLFDEGGPTVYGLTCRLYATPRGRRGCPTLTELVEALSPRSAV